MRYETNIISQLESLSDEIFDHFEKKANYPPIYELGDRPQLSKYMFSQ